MYKTHRQTPQSYHTKERVRIMNHKIQRKKSAKIQIPAGQTIFS